MFLLSGEGLCFVGLRLMRDELLIAPVVVTTVRLPRMSDFFGDWALIEAVLLVADLALVTDWVLRWLTFAAEVDRLGRAWVCLASAILPRVFGAACDPLCALSLVGAFFATFG